jgi:hypothetical protein
VVTGQSESDTFVARTLAALDDTVFVARWAKGRAMTLEQANGTVVIGAASLLEPDLADID